MSELPDKSLENTLGTAVPNWSGCQEPSRALAGSRCQVRPVNLPVDAIELFKLFANDPDQHLWDYLPYGPFNSASDYQQWLSGQQVMPTQQFYVITNIEGKVLGVTAFMRIDPANGSMEVGHLCFSSKIQRSAVTTEAMYLMMREAFELGYRRYEWKCNSLNQRSVKAAKRFGFQFEGIFRQAAVSKGRNRDTAWFSILDSEWPAIKSAFETWLAPRNFDQAGRQLASLAMPTTKQS